MITFRQRGNFDKTSQLLQRYKHPFDIAILNKYGDKGIEVLSAATPVDTGKTADSWYYKINEQRGSVSIVFYNSNINEGVLIAIILQYGHGTRTGGWVAGRDYINPAIQPIFDKIVENVWREVTGK